MTTIATAADHYVSEFETLERRGAFRSPAWLVPLRRAAIERLAEQGFPTTRSEDWRYTSLAALAEASFSPARGPVADLPAGSLDPFTLAGDGPRLVFIDGRYAAKLSSPRALPGGVRIGSLAGAMVTDAELVVRHLAHHARWDGNVFAALSTAFLEDGAFVYVPPEAIGEVPIELLYVAATPGVLAQPRTLIVAGPHSRVTVIERYVGLTRKAYFTNAVTEVAVAAGAAVDHYVVQEQEREAFHLATLHATLERDSTFSSCAAICGGRLARTTLGLELAGEGASGALSGLYVVGGRQHVDNHVTVDHAVPRGSSRQLYKGVLDGHARAVFNGRILVRRDAQKTDASQTNKHLLLSEGVEVDSKPQLEIFADDVKCTHGAAEGQLAPEALFYLRSRGLDEPTARALLTYGFAREVVERVAPEPLRAYLESTLMARLGAWRAAKEMA